MAGIDVNMGGRNRSVNAEINMIPFIDFLLVTVAFLLITAVWVTFSRIDANAQVPGPPGVDTPFAVERVLHLHSKDGSFALVWKHGATTIAEANVDKEPKGGSTQKYTALANAVAEQWREHGEHQDPADRKVDLCVLHLHNQEPFREVVAAMDAVYTLQRTLVAASGAPQTVPAFRVALASK